MIIGDVQQYNARNLMNPDADPSDTASGLGLTSIAPDEAPGWCEVAFLRDSRAVKPNPPLYRRV